MNLLSLSRLLLAFGTVYVDTVGRADTPPAPNIPLEKVDITFKRPELSTADAIIVARFNTAPMGLGSSQWTSETGETRQIVRELASLEVTKVLYNTGQDTPGLAFLSAEYRRVAGTANAWTSFGLTGHSKISWILFLRKGKGELRTDGTTREIWEVFNRAEAAIPYTTEAEESVRPYIRAAQGLK